MREQRGVKSAVNAIAIAVLLALVGTACSGGGGGSGDEAVDDPNGASAAPGESVVQFKGAGNLRLGGTVAIPTEGANGAVPGVVIVPTIGRVDRNGYLDNIPWDPVYQDLSKTLTGAGLATLRYDHRGIGTSKIEGSATQTFDDLVADAREAVSFLGQRRGIDAAGLALVGHDVGGLVALRVAAADDRVKSVVLLSTPGRPLVDILAGSFLASHGQESADAFRAVVGRLVSTGSLPERTSIRPEHQTLLPAGQDAILSKVFAIDPAADATQVKAPTLVVGGTQSPLVGAPDVERLVQAMGPSSQPLLASGTTATLQHVTAAGAQNADPDHRAHGGGRPPDQAKRDQPTLDAIAAFITAKVGGPRA
jgi:pimeloyl-ACP methyl ester carboxylesterase